MAKIAFFDLEDWEVDYIKDHLKGHELSFFQGKIEDEASDAEVLSVFIYSDVNKKILDKFPNLKLLTTMSTGFDHIDIKTCQEKNIVTCNVPSYGENTVAEHAMALLLALSRKIIPSVERTRKGDFTLDGLRGFDLKGKTIGILGTGRIGRHVAHFANSFDMKVIAFDKFPDETLAKECGYTYHSFDEVLAQSDVLSIHLPLNKETEHIINKDNINKIKKGCILINTARGPLIQSEAILQGLKDGTFSAAGLDVLEEENAIKEEKELLHEIFQKSVDLKTLLVEHMLIEQDNVIITPHNAFNTVEALQRILDTTIDNINSFYSGVPKNVIK